MPDITINFRTENLTRSEREKLLRDIAVIKREFSEAQRAANDFGQQTRRTLELVTQIPNVINPVVHALAAAQDDAHQELQQQETQIATSFQSQRTAIAAQLPTLQAKVATLETQLTALNAQKGVLEEQKTIVQTQKTDFQDQIPVIDKVVATTKRVNRELREQVDLAERVTAEIARHNTDSGRRDFQSGYASGRRGLKPRYDSGRSESTANAPNQRYEYHLGIPRIAFDGFPPRYSADYPDNRRLTVQRPAAAVRDTLRVAFSGFPPRYSADQPDNRRPTVQRPTATVRDTLFDLTQQQVVQKPTTAQRKTETEVRELPTHIQSIVDTVSNVPSDTLSFAYDALIEIPAQTREALQQLKTDTQQNITEIKDSEVLSTREKARQIETIEKNTAGRREAIEQEASQAKIDSFNRVVDNFIGGIGRMIAEQLKLRVATSLTNTLLGSPQGGNAGIGGLIGSVAPFLAVNPALAIGGGVALGAAALFSGSFDDPVNDALARRAGMQASQRRAVQAATELGRRSAVDLRDNFEQGFVSETARQTGSPRDGDAAPVIMNEIKLVIGAQELKAIYEETQRQITTGVIAR